MTCSWSNSRNASYTCTAIVEPRVLGDKQIEKAVEMLEPVVAIREKILTEDHPSRLASQHELAGACQAKGQIEEAVDLLEHVVAIRETTLTESRPDRLLSEELLQYCYEALDTVAQLQ
ncbi:hypothetical protein ACJA88_015103 [Fusarium oxysporum]